MKHQIIYLSILYIIIVNIISCSEDNRVPTNNNQNNNSTGWRYSIPLETGDGWSTAHSDSVGINHTLIERMVDDITTTTMPDINGMVIIRDGKLIFEGYWNGWNRDGLHMIMSCTKSFTSAMFGIAMDKGYITSVNDKLFDYFPDYDSYRTPRKDSILLRHVLTMSSGLKWWQEIETDPRNTLIKMIYADVFWINFLFNLEATYSPGEYFAYSDGMAMIAGEVIRRASGLSIPQFADSFLFNPLIINDVEWHHNIGGSFNTGFGLYLRPRDMAKFGQMYLNGGIWNGQQVVPKSWVDESTSLQYRFNNYINYGFYWWRRKYILNDGSLINTISARGRGGQYIYIISELNEIVVLTMNRPYGQGGEQAEWVLINHIIPATKNLR